MLSASLPSEEQLRKDLQRDQHQQLGRWGRQDPVGCELVTDKDEIDTNLINCDDQF